MNNLQAAQTSLDRELITIVSNTSKKDVSLVLQLCKFVNNQRVSKKAMLIA